jgi:hypothetical protein
MEGKRGIYRVIFGALAFEKYIKRDAQKLGWAHGVYVM